MKNDLNMVCLIEWDERTVLRVVKLKTLLSPRQIFRFIGMQNRRSLLFNCDSRPIFI